MPVRFRSLHGHMLVVSLLVIGLWPAASSAQGRDFKEQDLGGRNFSGQMLDGADFTGSTLRGANFLRASLRGAIFQEADLRNAGFSYADLTGADLRNAIMPLFANFANFSRANLEGLDLKGPTFFEINFRGANLRRTTGWGSVSKCNFRGADLRGANLMAAWATPQTSDIFAGAIYDGTTRWPNWVDVEASGAKRAE